MAKLFQPEQDGHAVWHLLHVMASRATTEKRKQRFVDFIEFLSEDYPCEKCRPHITQYLKDHPPKSYWNVTHRGREVGLLKWSWAFHNAVNTRLHKTLVDWPTAYNLYGDSGAAVCTAACTEGEPAAPYPVSIAPTLNQIIQANPRLPLVPSYKF